MINSIHPIPAFSDNYIWIITEQDSNKACVVDPGDAAPVLAYLEANNLILSDILITHHHPDHTGGIQELSAKYSPRIAGPLGSNIQGINLAAHEGDQLTLFAQTFSVLEVPGHTLDHIAFFCDDTSLDSPILFCGDTLFAAGCGRIFEGSPAMMFDSLAKLKSLPNDTNIYCTHEYTMANLKFALAADPDNNSLISRIASEQEKRDAGTPTLPSSVELEIATNPFLRCLNPALIKSAEGRLGHNTDNEVEVFTALRSWKDNF